MGYLSQRKKSERQQLFLKIMVIACGLYSFLLFFNSTDFSFLAMLKNYLFQAYVITFVLAVYAFSLTRWATGVFFLVCFLVQYGYLSASANIFLNNKIEQGTSIVLDKNSASPITVMPSPQAINVDFSKMPFRKRQQAFSKLGEFVSQQDIPVIIYGDWGETPWSRNFKSFMNHTGLQVKNKIKLFSCDYLFNPLAVPTFYVLAFANVGVEIVAPQEKGCAFAVSKLKVR